MTEEDEAADKAIENISAFEALSVAQAQANQNILSVLTRMGIGVALLAIFCLFSLGTVVYFVLDERAEDDERSEILEIIEEQTSPEAIQRQQENLQSIILLIDCNNRQGLQEVVDGLEAQGTIAGFSVLNGCTEPEGG